MFVAERFMSSVVNKYGYILFQHQTVAHGILKPVVSQTKTSSSLLLKKALLKG